MTVLGVALLCSAGGQVVLVPFGEEKGEAEDWLRYTGARPPVELSGLV